MVKEIILKSNIDDFPLSVKIYEAINEKAVVQIVHGMCEHQDRYAFFANELNKDGYTVVTSDMRGHGSSITSKDEIGYFGSKNGHLNLVEDQATISNYILKNYPNKKIFLFAHSMGTLITRAYLQKNDLLIDKLILCGAPCYNSLATCGIFLSKILSFFKGGKNHSSFLENLTTGQFNKSIKGTMKNEWISYNKENVTAFNNDPRCGFSFTNSGYKDLYKLMVTMHNHKKYDLSNYNLPILFLVGEDDPCVGGEKGLSSSISSLNKAGYKNIEKIIYQNARHELINEDISSKVIQDVKNFFNEGL